MARHVQYSKPRAGLPCAVSPNRFGMRLCVGVLSMLVFQVFQNVGIMPITGIPLPFMSYGGRSTLTAWIAVGLVLNVQMRRCRSTGS
jgi:rod shape determining protein RodA